MRSLTPLVGVAATVLASCGAGGWQRQQTVAVCSFDPEGDSVYVSCSDGTYFVGPVNGGTAAGGDRRGNLLYAVISLTDGRYSIAALP